MKKYNQSDNDVYNQLSSILEDLHLSLSIESNKGGDTIESLKESLQIRLGYYKIKGEEDIDPKSILEQASLELTKEGEELKRKYADTFFIDYNNS